MRICVYPDRLRHQSRRVHEVSSELNSLLGRLRLTHAFLNWEVRHQGRIDSQVAQALRMGQLLVADTQQMAQFLERTASRFEQADRVDDHVIASFFDALRNLIPKLNFLSFLSAAQRNSFFLLLASFGFPAIPHVRIIPFLPLSLIAISQLTSSIGSVLNWGINSFKENIDKAKNTLQDMRDNTVKGIERTTNAFNFYKDKIEKDVKDFVSNTINSIVQFPGWVNSNFARRIPNIDNIFDGFNPGNIFDGIKDVTLSTPQTDDRPYEGEIRSGSDAWIFSKISNLQDNQMGIARISKDGEEPPKYVILVRGLNPFKIDALNNLFAAISEASHETSPYYQSVLKSILKHVPAGAEIYLAGHSLGGMIVNDLVRSGDLTGRTGDGQNRYTIKHAVTYGSPYNTTEAPGVKYTHYIDKDDSIAKIHRDKNNDGVLDINDNVVIVNCHQTSDLKERHNSYHLSTKINNTYSIPVPSDGFYNYQIINLESNEVMYTETKERCEINPKYL